MTRDYKIISGSVLKIIALAAMTADHCAVALMGLSDGMPLRIFGRIAFLLCEGAEHTGNPIRYITRLGLLAVVSEIPYNLLFFSCLWHPEHQSILVTLTLSLAAITVWDLLKDNPVEKCICTILIVAAAQPLGADYGIWGTALPLVFHLLKDVPAGRTAAGVLLCQNIYQAPAYILTALYNGERGFIGRRLKWAFYAYYPAHLLVLLAIKNLVE